MGLCRNGKSCIVEKFHRTDLVICSHSREGKTLSYSQTNTVPCLPFSRHASYNYNCFIVWTTMVIILGVPIFRTFAVLLALVFSCISFQFSFSCLGCFFFFFFLFSDM